MKKLGKKVIFSVRLKVSPKQNALYSLISFCS